MQRQRKRDQFRMWRHKSAQRGFTLIELLVVISVIALLLSILLPALGRARAAAKLSVCASNMRQMGVGITVYSNEQRGFAPIGPHPGDENDFVGTSRFATNMMWYGTDMSRFHTMQYTGAGLLLKERSMTPRALFCPADDTFDMNYEIDQIGNEESAFGSYFIRQRDFLAPGYDSGKIDNMGANVVDGRRISVEALAIEVNVLGPGLLYHTSHQALSANVLYRDGSVTKYDNKSQALTIGRDAFHALPGSMIEGLDQVLLNADFAYGTTTLGDAPRIYDN